MNKSTENKSVKEEPSISLTVNGKLTIQGLPEEDKEKIKSYLSLKNPSYYQAVRANPKAKYAISEFIRYYREDKRTDELIVSRGSLNKVRDYLERRGLRYQIHSLSCEVSRCGRRSSIELRDYQAGIPEQITQHPQGIIKLYTGFGKTIIALKVAELLQQKTLIITPKVKIYDQFVQEYKKYFGTDIGEIRGKKISIKDVTVATVASLRNWIGKTNPSKTEFGAIIVDECHLFVPEKSRHTIEYFNAHYRYGMSATPDRSDGQGKAVEFIFGDVIIDISQTTALPDVEVVTFNDALTMGEYHDIIYEQVENEKRNQLIASQVEKAVGEGRRVLVLTKRIAHYDAILERLRCKAFAIRSSDPDDESNALIRGLRDSSIDFDCILGTYSMLSTGFDLAVLDTIILAGDLKSTVLTTQSIGRVLRSHPDKKPPKVIDIWDRGNKILEYQGKQRQEFYKEKGWKLKNKDLK